MTTAINFGQRDTSGFMTFLLKIILKLFLAFLDDYFILITSNKLDFCVIKQKHNTSYFFLSNSAIKSPGVILDL